MPGKAPVPALSFLLPVTCLGDVYRVSPDLVAVLVAVTAIGVVGRLFRLFGVDSNKKLCNKFIIRTLLQKYAFAAKLKKVL